MCGKISSSEKGVIRGEIQFFVPVCRSCLLDAPEDKILKVIRTENPTISSEELLGAATDYFGYMREFSLPSHS
ncbi:MAG TPA: hypothetical protein DEB07_03750 [Candidatus Moranbacteria bacterium]|nr:hypothetical protein [Candidatus Moranbacteria bacterium]